MRRRMLGGGAAAAVPGLYDTLLAAGPLGIWNFNEASGNFQDGSGNGNHMAASSGTLTYRNWTGPDGVDRVSVSGGTILTANPAASAGINALASGITLVWTGQALGPAYDFMAGDGNSQGVWRVFYDAATYLWFQSSRSTGAAYRNYRLTMTPAAVGAMRFLAVEIPDGNTAPTVYIDGAAGVAMTSFSGPTGTLATFAGPYYMAGYRAGNITANVGVQAVFAGVGEDIAEFQAVAGDEGWF